MNHNKPLFNPIPKDIPADKTLFQINHCKYDHFIAEISYVVYVDPQKLANERDVELKNELFRTIELILNNIDQQKVLIILPRTSKFRSLRYNLRQTNYLIWAELKTEDHFFRFEHFQKTATIKKSKSDRSILLKKISQKSLNLKFIAKQKNHLVHFIPNQVGLNHLLKLIHIPDVFRGEQLCLSLNSTLNQAICYFSNQSFISFDEEYPSNQTISELLCSADPNWRKFMAFEIARHLDFKKYAVKAIYLIGSSKNNAAGMGSDIDLMIHFAGTDAQKANLNLWLEGWSCCLSVMNYLKTGYQTDGILDIHYISDESIAQKDSFTIKINAVTDPALLLKAIDN